MFVVMILMDAPEKKGTLGVLKSLPLSILLQVELVDEIIHQLILIYKVLI